MNILSIQSHVAYGHVGNAAAVFPMQRLGVEVWPVHTVQFSNHTGYGAWRGQVFEADHIRDVVAGIEARGVFGRCDAVLSGYMGSDAIGAAVLDAVDRVKAANAGAFYACDPVLGDTGRGIFVRPGVPEFFRDRAVPAADLVTPNQFELEFLVGGPIADRAALRAAAGRLLALGPKVGLVTSVLLDETPGDALDLVAFDRNALFRLRTPRLDLAINGAGDAIAALFLVHYLRERAIRPALEAAGSAVFGLLRRTAETGSREIQLVAAQDEVVAPARRFVAEAL